MKNMSFLAGSLIAALLVAGSGSLITASAEVGNQAKETLATRIQNFEDQLNSRLVAAFARAENLRARVLERASGIQSPKFDLALVNQTLAEATMAITTGRQEIETIQEAITKARAAGSPSAKSLKELRMMVRDAMMSVRIAHQQIVGAIQIMKNAYLSPLIN